MMNLLFDPIVASVLTIFYMLMKNFLGVDLQYTLLFFILLIWVRGIRK